LPEPVGAEISVCSPVAIAGQACAWAGVGAAKARSNHSLTCGVKAESGTYQRVRPAGRALARAARTLCRVDVDIRLQLAKRRPIALATHAERCVTCAHVKRRTTQPAAVSVMSRARSSSNALGDR
jgi:hypothetical protein